MVTALGCFGGGFNMDNGFSFRFHTNCQTSCLTISQVCVCHRAKRGSEVPVRAGATPRTFGLKAEKVGSLPPNLVIFSVSLFSSSCLLFPRFPETYEDHKEKKMVKAKLKYVIPTFFSCFAQILTARTEGSFLLGWSDPRFTFGHGNVHKSGVAPAQCSVLPASKLIVGPCATSCTLGTCSSAKVTARVTQMVICVFRAHFTFPRCK